MIDAGRSFFFLIVGYVVAVIIWGVYLASLVIRWMKLKRDLEALLQAENPSSQTAQTPL